MNLRNMLQRANIPSKAGRRFAVSNIAWADLHNDRMLDILAREGARGVELAASLVWPEPVKTTNRERMKYCKAIQSKGLSITGLHSLLYARQDVQLLGAGEGYRTARDYLMRTVDLCADLGGRYMVIGGPRNRRRGALSVEEAKKRGAVILHEVGGYAASCGCFFALEALPAPECDFVTNLRECEELVRLANTPGVQLHLDTGAADVTDRELPDETLIEILQHAPQDIVIYSTLV